MKTAIGALTALFTATQASAFLPSINLKNDVKKMRPFYYIDPSSSQASDENWNPKKAVDTKDTQGKVEEIENFKQALSMMNTASISSEFSGPELAGSEAPVIAEVLTELAQILASENNNDTDPLTMDEVVTALKKGSSAAVDLAIDTAELAFIVASLPEFKHEAANILSGNVKGLVKVPALLKMKMRNLDISRVEMMKGAASSIWTSKNKEVDESIGDRLAYFEHVKARLAKQNKDALSEANNSNLLEAKQQEILPPKWNGELEEKKQPSNAFASSIANAYVKTASYDEPTMLKVKKEDQSGIESGATPDVQVNDGKSITQAKTSEDKVQVLQGEVSPPVLSNNFPNVEDIDGPEGAYVMAQAFAEDMVDARDGEVVVPVIAKDAIEQAKLAIKEAVEAVAEVPATDTVKEAPVVEASEEAVKAVAEVPVIDTVKEAPVVEASEEAPVVEASEEAVEAVAEVPVIDTVKEAPVVEASEEAPVVEASEEAVEAVAEVPATDTVKEALVVEASEEAPVVEASEEAVEAVAEEQTTNAVEEAPFVVAAVAVEEHVDQPPPAEDPVSLQASVTCVEDKGFIEAAEAAIMKTIEEEAFNGVAEAVTMQSYNQGSFVETTTHTVSKPFFGTSTNYLDDL